MFLFFDAIKLIRDIRSKGTAIRIWGGLLNLPQLIGGIFFIATTEGLVVLVTAIVALVVAGQIHKRTPFSRLTGLCHLPWLVLLPWLIYRLQSYDHSVLMKGWLTYVAATIFISLVLDAFDVFRYLRGQRTFSWAK